MLAAYLSNLLKIALGKRLLNPLVGIYYLTTHCNLNCSYCEDFGARRNAENQPAATPEAAKKILRVLRSGMDTLWLTGGEPLLVPHLADLLDYAKKVLRFRHISLITNGTLLPSRQNILPYLDRLVISLDALDAHTWSALNLPDSYAENILNTIQQTAKLQKQYQFQLALNAVITPETLAQNGLSNLVDFCKTNHILISFSPQASNNWPRYELITGETYLLFSQYLATCKAKGGPILGSDLYLEHLQKNQPYDCYPSLAPRILPNGDLVYPCLPIEKAGDEHGGRPINLLTTIDWKTALQTASAAYGEPPSMCVSCFQQCYAEPSLMQQNPLACLLEKNSLATYVPG